MDTPAPRVERHEKPDFPISIHHIRSEGGNALDIHCHGDLEILRIARGEAVFRIGTTSYAVAEGDILFVNPFEFHSATAEPGQAVAYDAIVYERRLLESITLHPDYHRFIRPLLENRLQFPHQLERGAPSSAKIRRVVHDILDEYQEKRLGHEWMIRTHLEQLVVLLTRLVPPPAERAAPSAQQRLGRDLAPLFARLAENPAQPMSTRDAAAIARMSPYHFCRQFKAFSGITFVRFLHLYRVNEAERLLRDTSLTVTEIAERVGFGNVHYFDRVFHTHKGRTPGQVRREAAPPAP